jgi:alginate O-acetyltransferase complex protein AlgI
MQFNSIEFLFCFLPLFLMAYHVIPVKLRSVSMVMGSLLFYWFSSGGNLWWIGLLLGVTLAAYIIGRWLGKSKNPGLLAFSLGALLGILTFFKLYNGGRHLPAGMSFFLFQIAAYLIDVYRRRILPEGNPISFTEQITFFPKLLSGPLMDPQTLKLQQKYSQTNRENLHRGLQLLICGLGLKVCIANRLGSLWNQGAVIGYESISPAFAWLCLIGYAMQLYFDFYGYSLMAMGIGKMFGYDLPENFLDPYASRSVSEFYRRWHASLGAWFRNYLYFPLGGSRKGSGRTIFNLAVVWLFTGLWHGVGGNYLLWAGMLFALIVLEKLWLGKVLKKAKVLSHAYVVVAILLTWVPFAVGDPQKMVVFFGRLFGQLGTTLNPEDYIAFGADYFPILAAGTVLATPIPRKLAQRWKDTTLGDLILFALFWVVVYFISTAAQDPFLYFAY